MIRNGKPAGPASIAMREEPTVCILAGGLGTRLGSLSQSTPKAMISVAGEPFLVHQLRLLAREGLRRVVLCVGHLGNQIEERVGHDCEGLALVYSYDGPGLEGTLGAVRRARPFLGRNFLLMYGDTYLRVDYLDFYRAWTESDLSAGMTVLRNEGRWDRSNVIYGASRVLCYDKRAERPEMHWIDYGLSALSADALDLLPGAATDLAELYRELSIQGELFGYEVENRFFEIGSPASLRETSEFFERMQTKP